MPSAAVVAAALTNHAARTWGLFLDGLDVSKEPATPARYAVLMDSVRLHVDGNGDGVGTLTFSIDDPSNVITVQTGMQVRMHYLTSDNPYFLGYVDRYSVRPDLGQVGRVWDVSCVSISTVLDWAVTVRDLAFTTQVSLNGIIQAIIGNSSGVGSLRAFADPANNSGSNDFPMGLAATNTYFNLDAASAVIPFAISAGTNVRDAIQQAIAACGQTIGTPMTVYVDEYEGLRVFASATPPNSQTDFGYGVSATQDTHGIELTVDAGGVVRGVLVKGTGVTVLVTDGSGKAGRVAVLNDSNITTTAGAQAAAVAYIADHAQVTRGSFRYEGPTLYHAPDLARSPITLTMANLGLSARGYVVAGIDVDLFGTTGGTATKANLAIDFGGTRPSAMAQVRRLTRGTLS